MKRIHWALVGLAAVFLANSANAFVSEKEVRRQARVMWLSMKRHVPLESDPQVIAYVQCISKTILAQIPPEYADLDWEVVVFDEDSVNAFADPNGKIGVFTGLLDVADTPDALAAVIGHEVAHAVEGHSMAMAKRGVRQDLWVMLGAVRRRTSGSRATGRHDRTRLSLCARAGDRSRPRRSSVHGQCRLRPAGVRLLVEEHGRCQQGARPAAYRSFFRRIRPIRRVSTR